MIARHGITSRFGSEEMKANFPFYLKTLPNRDNGQNISPMNAILTLNDIRTLRSKMDLFSRNTQVVAEFLESHSQVEKACYLGLKSHSLHDLANKYLYLVDAEHDSQYGQPVNRHGHLMSFCVKGDAQKTRNVLDGLQRIWRATDLGRVKSIATIPAISTHSQQGEEGRKMADIPANLIRLCVGGEHPADVIQDLDQALNGADGKVSQQVPYEYSFGGASRAGVIDG